MIARFEIRCRHVATCLVAVLAASGLFVHARAAMVPTESIKVEPTPTVPRVVRAGGPTGGVGSFASDPSLGKPAP